MRNLLSSKDFLNDAIFRKQITEYLTEIANDRQLLIDNTSIYNKKHNITTEVVLKRDAYSRLEERGLLNVDNILKETELILNLKSQLTSCERQFLGTLLQCCMQDTITYYKNQNK